MPGTSRQPSPGGQILRPGKHWSVYGGSGNDFSFGAYWCTVVDPELEELDNVQDRAHEERMAEEDKTERCPSKPG